MKSIFEWCRMCICTCCKLVESCQVVFPRHSMVKLTTVRTVLYSISYTLPNTMNSKLGSCCTKIVFLYRSYECDNKSEKDGNLSSTNILLRIDSSNIFHSHKNMLKSLPELRDCTMPPPEQERLMCVTIHQVRPARVIPWNKLFQYSSILWNDDVSAKMTLNRKRRMREHLLSYTWASSYQ